jgi:hypothetical protein
MAMIKWDRVVVLRRFLLVLLCLGVFAEVRARADVTVFLQGALGVSGEGSSAGHVSLYFSNICSDSPVELRLCKPGEMGVVIAYYPDFGTDQNHEWLAIPVLHYLYGVEDESRIPIYVNGEIRVLLREAYRRKYLTGVVSDTAVAIKPDGRWREVIGTLYNREIYSFTFKTTPKQDAAVVEKINSMSNKKRFNLIYYNCADFTREIFNAYFPGAAHRDMLNDFTMTSPKAIAKSTNGYGHSHPELLFTVNRYTQLPGPIRRSLNPRNFSEHAIKSKKYLIPQLLFKPLLTAIFATSYYTIGRFDPYKAFVEFGSAELARLNLEEYQLKKNIIPVERDDISVSGFGDTEGGSVRERPSLKTIAEKKGAEHLRLFGEKKIWDKYKADFAPILQKAIDEGLFADYKEVRTFFKDLELQSEPAFDDNNDLILKVRDYGEDHVLGLTRENILGSRSNSRLAYKLLLAIIDAQLKTGEKKRELLGSFTMNWDLMTRLSARDATISGTNGLGSNGSSLSTPSTQRRRFLENPEKKTLKQKIQKIFILITH